MRAYTEYSQIDAKWLGVIPSHWDCKKIGTLFSQRKEKVSDKDFAPLSVTKNGILPQLSNAAKSNDGDNRKLVRTGDFVINSRSDRKGSCGVSSFNGSVSLINIVLTPRQDLNRRYVHYLLRSQPFSEEYYRYGRGIVDDLWTTRYSEMKNIYIPIPPRSEQDQIVRYLDWQVSKTNKLISARKKQIALLKEQKQAVINEAVTKGLDPAVPMKDSGVEWIGEIPAEWSLVPLYSIAKVISMTNKEDEELLSVYLDEGVIPFSQKEEKRTNPTSKDLSKYQYVRYGNLVLNNQQAWRGSVGVSKFEGIVSPAYIILELSKCLNTDYANLLFRGKNMVYQYGLASKGVGSIQRNLYWPHLKRAFVLLPPLPIQKEIVRYIVKRCAKIDALISNIHSEIALLVEYRTRLISDVVTGQIDVRDIEVPEFEYIADDVDDVSDDENTDLEEIMEEEE
jgi:type I restriction enzyme S subunit